MDEEKYVLPSHAPQLPRFDGVNHLHYDVAIAGPVQAVWKYNDPDIIFRNCVQNWWKAESDVPHLRQWSRTFDTTLNFELKYWK